MEAATGYFSDIYAQWRGKLTDPAREHDYTYKYPPPYRILEGPGAQEEVHDSGAQEVQATAPSVRRRPFRGQRR